MGHKKFRSAPPLPAGAGFSAAEQAAMVEARRQAEGGTPAVVLDVLLGQPITIGAVTLPVITLGHVLLLQKIKSPLALAGGGEPTNEQINEALFVLNTPVDRVLSLLRQPPEQWETAVFTFAINQVPLAHLPAIGRALGAQLAAAQSTVIGSSSPTSAHSPASSGEGTGAADGAKKNAIPAAPVTSAGAPASRPRPTA